MKNKKTSPSSHKYQALAVLCSLALFQMSCTNNPKVGNTAEVEPSKSREVASQASDSVDLTKIFKLDTEYKFAIDNQGLFGKAKMKVEQVNNQQVVHFTLPIRVLASYAFSSSDTKYFLDAVKEMVKKNNGKWSAAFEKTYKQGLFVKGAKSVNELPLLKKTILEKFKAIEELYSTSFSKLHIQPEFVVDEAAIYDADDIYKENLKDLAKELKDKDKHMSPFQYLQAIEAVRYQVLRAHFEEPENAKGVFTTFITSMNTVGFLYPTLLHFDADNHSWAHEIGHLFYLSMNGEEGYLIHDYPPHGIMNDVATIEEAKSAGLTPRLHRSEFHSMLLYIARKSKPAVKITAAKQLLKYNTDQFKRMIEWGDNRNYFDVPPPEALPTIRRKISDWIKNHPDDR